MQRGERATKTVVDSSRLSPRKRSWSDTKAARCCTQSISATEFEPSSSSCKRRRHSLPLPRAAPLQSHKANRRPPRLPLRVWRIVAVHFLDRCFILPASHVCKKWRSWLADRALSPGARMQHGTVLMEEWARSHSPALVSWACARFCRAPTAAIYAAAATGATSSALLSAVTSGIEQLGEDDEDDAGRAAKLRALFVSDTGRSRGTARFTGEERKLLDAAQVVCAAAGRLLTVGALAMISGGPSAKAARRIAESAIACSDLQVLAWLACCGHAPTAEWAAVAARDARLCVLSWLSDWYGMVPDFDAEPARTAFRERKTLRMWARETGTRSQWRQTIA